MLALRPVAGLLILTATLPLYYTIFHFRPRDQLDLFRHGVVWLIWIPAWVVLALEFLSPRAAGAPRGAAGGVMREGRRISVVIPALDEEQAIGKVIAAIPPWIDRIVVADNGSTDRTSGVAPAGARVVHEPQRGYGAACLAGIAQVGGHGHRRVPRRRFQRSPRGDGHCWSTRSCRARTPW